MFSLCPVVRTISWKSLLTVNCILMLAAVRLTHDITMYDNNYWLTIIKSDLLFFSVFRTWRTRWSRRIRRCGDSWRTRSRPYLFPLMRRVSNGFFRVTTPSWWNRPCWITSFREIAISRKSAASWTPKDTESLRRWVSDDVYIRCCTN